MQAKIFRVVARARRGDGKRKKSKADNFEDYPVHACYPMDWYTPGDLFTEGDTVSRERERDFITITIVHCPLCYSYSNSSGMHLIEQATLIHIHIRILFIPIFGTHPHLPTLLTPTLPDVSSSSLTSPLKPVPSPS
jgi:hypothetical protein